MQAGAYTHSITVTGQVEIPPWKLMCGTRRTTAFEYVVRISCSKLDEKGFVVKAEDMGSIFGFVMSDRERKWTCEEIAHAAIPHATGLCQRGEPQSIYIRIAPIPFMGRYVESEWRRQEG